MTVPTKRMKQRNRAVCSKCNEELSYSSFRRHKDPHYCPERPLLSTVSLSGESFPNEDHLERSHSSIEHEHDDDHGLNLLGQSSSGVEAMQSDCVDLHNRFEEDNSDENDEEQLQESMLQVIEDINPIDSEIVVPEVGKVSTQKLYIMNFFYYSLL